MFKIKPHRFAFVLGLLLLFILACTGTSQSIRVGEFPQGKQTDVVTSAFLSGMPLSNILEKTYAEPYANVWAATVSVAERFDKIGRRPVVAIDEKNGRIQNGRISQDTLIGSGTGAWVDEFVMEVTSLSDNQTKVSVFRRVITSRLKRRSTGYSREWREDKSNGQIENWLLTQIEGEIAK